MRKNEKQLLSQRLGKEFVERRLEKEKGCSTTSIPFGSASFKLAALKTRDNFIRLFLKLTGIDKIAKRHYLDIRYAYHKVFLTRLPEEFDGFIILQLTDLHIDHNQELAPALAEILKKAPSYDLIVITGDFRNHQTKDLTKVVKLLDQALAPLKRPIYAVLGNHDRLPMLQDFKPLGIEFLVNENITLKRGESILALCGIDDASFFETHNFEKALHGLKQSGCKILLSHTPSVYEEAARFGFDLMLCGHTHGGQFSLPGAEKWHQKMSKHKKRLSGHWQYQDMQGYTNPGTGAVSMPYRLFVKPEITVHRLYRQE